MSHFTVLIIGNDIEGQLNPFQENNMGDCPEELLEFNSVEEEYRPGWEKATEGQTFDEYMEDTGYKKDEKSGHYGYWENPNAKWDWWKLGGRWTGMFKLKEDSFGALGQPGLMTEEGDEGYADQARKRDVDFGAMRDEAEKEASEKYDAYEKATGGIEPPDKPWEEFLKDFKDMKDAREAFHEHPWNKAISGIGPFFDCSHAYFCVKTGGRATFTARAREKALQTFAVLKDGKWYERGEMGWWGCVGNEKDAYDWSAEFGKLLDELPEDTLLSVVDCHI